MHVQYYKCVFIISLGFNEKRYRKILLKNGYQLIKKITFILNIILLAQWALNGVLILKNLSLKSFKYI